MEKNKIILIGFMSSGKTTIGKILSEKLSINYYDLDSIIENKYEKSISKIFETSGESFFRKIENEELKQILNNKKKFIISTGGGIVETIENIEIISNSNSIVIYLDCSIEVLQERLKNSTNRPVLKNGNIKSLIFEKLKRRKKSYEKCSNLKIGIDNDETEFQTVEKIKKLI